MEDVNLASGYIKVERSQDEKRRAYSVDTEVMRDLKNKTSNRIAEVIIKSYNEAKEKG